MLRNPLSFIFKLGKHRSLQFRPLRQLGEKGENSSLPPPTSSMMRDVPAKNEPAQNSNQMSS
jgi:hypothetical protein